MARGVDRRRVAVAFSVSTPVIRGSEGLSFDIDITHILSVAESVVS